MLTALSQRLKSWKSAAEQLPLADYVFSVVWKKMSSTFIGWGMSP